MEGRPTSSPQATQMSATEQAMQNLQIYLASVSRYPYRLASLGITSQPVIKRVNTYGSGNNDVLQNFQRALLAFARPTPSTPNTTFGSFFTKFASDERDKLQAMIEDVERMLEQEGCPQLTAVRTLHAELDNSISSAVVAFQAVVGLEHRPSPDAPSQ